MDDLATIIGTIIGITFWLTTLALWNIDETRYR